MNSTSTSLNAVAIDDAQRAHYRTNGWLRIPGILNAGELQTIRRACEESEALELRGHLGLTHAGSPEGEKFAHQAHDNYQKMFRSKLDLRFSIPALRPIVRKLAGYACALLDVGEVRILYDKTVNKPAAAEGTRQTVWHQDLPYIPVDRRGLCTFWLPAQDVTIESGAMRFVPGSHRLGPLGRVDLIGKEHSYQELLRPTDLAAVGDAVPVPLRAGDATVHDGLTLHGASPNASAKTRFVWACIFVPADTLWTGAPYSHDNISDKTLKVNRPFDHADFQIP